MVALLSKFRRESVCNAIKETSLVIKNIMRSKLHHRCFVTNCFFFFLYKRCQVFVSVWAVKCGVSNEEIRTSVQFYLIIFRTNMHLKSILHDGNWSKTFCELKKFRTSEKSLSFPSMMYNFFGNSDLFAKLINSSTVNCRWMELVEVVAEFTCWPCCWDECWVDCSCGCWVSSVEWPDWLDSCKLWPNSAKLWSNVDNLCTEAILFNI